MCLCLDSLYRTKGDLCQEMPIFLFFKVSAFIKALELLYSIRKCDGFSTHEKSHMSTKKAPCQSKWRRAPADGIQNPHIAVQQDPQEREAARREAAILLVCCIGIKGCSKNRDEQMGTSIEKGRREEDRTTVVRG